MFQSTRGYDGLGEYGGGAGHGGQGGVAVDSHKGGMYYDDVRYPAFPGSASRRISSVIHGGGYINITANTTRLDGMVLLLVSVGLWCSCWCL